MGAGRSSAEAGGPSRLACVDWPVCEFFMGLLRGPRCSHALMTHGAVSVYLSAWPSAQSCTTTAIPSFIAILEYHHSDDFRMWLNHFMMMHLLVQAVQNRLSL